MGFSSTGCSEATVKLCLYTPSRPYFMINGLFSTVAWCKDYKSPLLRERPVVCLTIRAEVRTGDEDVLIMQHFWCNLVEMNEHFVPGLDPSPILLT